MKKVILTLLTFFIGISCVDAQYINYKDDSGWNFGLNIGGTWQEKEPSYGLLDTTFSKPFAGFQEVLL